MYITLLSNVSVQEYENKIARFRTKLGKSVSLVGDWYVGLSEITYTKSWFNVLHPVPITLFDELGNNYGSNDNNEDFILSAGFYESPQKLVNAINEILTKFSQIHPPKILFNELNNYVTLKAGKIDNVKLYPFLGEELDDLLGLKNRNEKYNVYSTNKSVIGEYIFRGTDIYRNDYFKAYHPVEISGGYQSLYMYSDIVYPSLIGDTCAPIMRIVEVPRKYKFGDTVHINYEKPHYRQLMVNDFETIEISIYDDAGKLIPFQFGKVALTLHFIKL